MSDKAVAGAVGGIGCLAILVWLAVWGVIIWAIVQLVQHFTG